ncbi:Quinate permease [Cyphellophora attinorum]|uniref:Quinate permease n=1 Tax=Cyphellophora attinorum TaxID=1664694 RepID=A0A0N1HFX0_9EURO|nr:Quinate permease [Phialophora attinorum]KPI44847.1 Quinate permease [Phialophora attinorum]
MVKSSLLSTTREAIRESPRELFNWYLIFCTLATSFSGVAKGFDEGNIASIVVMPVFMKKFGVSHQTEDEYANTKGWIVSIATAGAVFGCLSCSWLNSRLGRKKTLLLYTIIYIAGVLGQTGFGIGGTTVVPSIYLSEIAPKPIRGLITVQYAACQQLGVVFGFFLNYGVTKYHAGTQLQWQLPTALQVVPAVIWGIAVLFIAESPRWLLSVNRRSEAITNLTRIRGLPVDNPYVASELSAIDLQIQHEADVETLGVVENRRRFWLMFLAHLFGQWSGANAITQYSPTILGYLGIAGTETKFLTTGIYGIVKFVSVVLFAFFIVDFIGRATNGMSAKEIANSATLRHTSTAAIVAIFLHAVAWSIGWFSAPYLINAEIFPIRIRSLNMSFMMAMHWLYYFGCSRAMPSLLAATHRWGAFVFFASICAVSLVFVFFCMPETAGRSLESMDTLFERPLWHIRKVAYPTKVDLMLDAGRRESEDGWEDAEKAAAITEQREVAR